MVEVVALVDGAMWSSRDRASGGGLGAGRHVAEVAHGGVGEVK